MLKSCKVDSRPHLNISKSKNLKRNHKCHFKEPFIATWFIGSIFQLKNCLMKKLKLRFRSPAFDSLHLRTSRVLRNRYRAIWKKKRKEKNVEKTEPYFYIPLFTNRFYFECLSFKTSPPSNRCKSVSFWQTNKEQNIYLLLAASL